MKNIFKKIKLVHVLSILVLLLTISTSYFIYKNYKINKVVDFNNSKNCNPSSLEEAYFNISKYGTTTNKVNCGYGNNINMQPSNLNSVVANDGLYPMASTLNLYTLSGNLSTGTISIESQNKFVEMQDNIIGCYYMTDNINEKVKLDRNNSFSKFVEGMNRFAQINGSYTLSYDLKSIAFIPFEESKFSLKLEIGTSSIKLIDEKELKKFKKETCADFYPNY